MIRNVSIHVSGEQPLLCDLYDLPNATDAGLVCTNVRGTDGKRPVFIDASASTFFFPFHVIRFVEIPQGAAAGHQPGGQRDTQARDGGNVVDAEGDPGSLIPVALGTPEPAPADDPDAELEIDEDILQRIRDI